MIYWDYLNLFYIVEDDSKKITKFFTGYTISRDLEILLPSVCLAH